MVYVDGHQFIDEESAPDMGTISCVKCEKAPFGDLELRTYTGKIADVEKLPKWGNLATGSKATFIDSADEYIYVDGDWYKKGESASAPVRTKQRLTVTENKTVNTPEGKFYDPIIVNVPLHEGKLEFKLYAFDYGDGAIVAYAEKEAPVVGDLIYLKKDMDEGEITDCSQLGLVYHVISDNDGVIVVSEHPEGQTGGFSFTRDESKDYIEEITDVRDIPDIVENGLYVSPKGTMFKMLNLKVGE